MDKSLEIFLQILGPNHEEVANGYNNYGNIILHDLKPGACKKAIEHYHKCIAIFETKSDEIQSKIMHIVHTNISRAMRILGNFDESCRKWALRFFGPDRHLCSGRPFKVFLKMRFLRNAVHSVRHLSLRVLAAIFTAMCAAI